MKVHLQYVEQVINFGQGDKICLVCNAYRQSMTSDSGELCERYAKVITYVLSGQRYFSYVFDVV